MKNHMPVSSPTAQELYLLHRFADPLPWLKTIDLSHETQPHCRIEMKNCRMKLHSSLPETELWTYAGLFPGPVIEVRRDSRVDIEWLNLLQGTIPVQGMMSAEGDPQDPSQNHAGGQPGELPKDPYFEKVRGLTAWTVVHLHGGRTEPDSDGWTENVTPYGASKLSHYDTALPPGQHAPMLWFHDHAMGVTRYNVYAGLIGLWIIRDERDQAILEALRRAHEPPDGEDLAPLEIPMVIADRNLQTESGEADGHLTGQLLHKTDDGPQRESPVSWPGNWIDRGPMEFFGPFTLINGAIWPHCTLQPRAYRLRIVNASNARTYQLVLARVIGGDDGSERMEAVRDPKVLRQIGSDGGLFRHPVVLPDLDEQLALTLAPAERADLILDLSSFPDGANLRWINTAVAPFDGSSASSALGEPDLPARNPFPQVLEFRVRGSQGRPLVLPDPLCEYPDPPPPDQLGDHESRLIVLAEQEDIHDAPPPAVHGSEWKRTTMLTLREMQLLGFVNSRPTIHGHFSLPVLTGPPGPGEMDIDFFLAAPAGAPAAVQHHRCRYGTLAAMFSDSIRYFVKFGGREIWNILNLTGDVHPFHIHLVQFRHYGRAGYFVMDQDPFPPDEQAGPTITYRPENTATGGPRTDENELGWKDTIRANPGELLKILATFDGFAGRFMYHCHILEHEDHEMMRPFIVLPAGAMDLMSGMAQMPPMAEGHSVHQM